MTEPITLHAIVQGRVQGVYFRAFVAKCGKQPGLIGYARNLPDGTVEVRAEGYTEQLQKLVDKLHKGPPAARVVSVETDWSNETEGHTAFKIRY